MRALRIAFVLALLALAGCRAQRVPTYALGRYHTPADHVLFETVVRALLDEGYQITLADESRGVIEVGTHWHPRDAPTYFVLRLRRPGWVVIDLRGPGIDRDEDGYRVAARLALEVHDFALALRTRLDRAAEPR